MGLGYGKRWPGARQNGATNGVAEKGRATGTRLVITLLYELRRRKKKYGLATACIGGGQGIAMVVESFQ
jgi:acetyl-CoA acetyltransferase